MKSIPVKIILCATICAGLAVVYWAGYQKGVAGALIDASTIAKKRAGLGLTIKVVDDPRLANASLDGLLHGPIKPDAGLLAQWALGLSPQERLDALNKLQSMSAGEPRDDILKAIVTALAQTDPKGFLASTSNVTNARLRESGVSSALQKLGASSPSDALDWIKQNAADVSANDLSRRYEATMNGYATVDPAGALNAASALGEGTRNDRQVKSRAMEGIAEGMSSQGNFSDAVALFNQMPAGQYQNDALGRVADLWAVAAPQDAANWIATVPDTSRQNDLGQNLTDVWGNSDPAAAATWAAQIDQAVAASSTGGNNNNGDSMMTHVMDDWTKTDLNAAGQYINQMPASPVKDEAIASFAAHAAQDDPAAAMNWVASMTDPQAQQQATQQVVKQWIKQDPSAAAQFLNTTDMLTPQQKQKLAASLPGNKPANSNQGSQN